ncbi:MAG: hypothetical protein IKK75_13115 [Clostridia bacterium]|nr:hypothetical protein [Clostridia bacterium]
MKAITVRFHLNHPAEKQAWEKLLSLRDERHLSFSQVVTDALNAYGTDTPCLTYTEKDQLVREVADAVARKLQQMLPAYLAGYAAGANASPVVPVANDLPAQAAPQPLVQEQDDAMPDFGDSCMDFDFIGG